MPSPMQMTSDSLELPTDLPNWVPDGARHYLLHTQDGQSIRALARQAGCHASTVLRQVRKLETRRDDPLVDEALKHLGQVHFSAKEPPLSFQSPIKTPISEICTDEPTIEREARRILRRLQESGAVLAVAQDMEKAVVVRSTPDGGSTRTATVDRPVAYAMVLKEWIAPIKTGRITRYEITAPGRSALKRLLDAQRRDGLDEDQSSFAMQHRDMRTKKLAAGDEVERVRYNAAESPLSSLARRRDKDGKPFLAEDLVSAGERLREDFELAHIGPRVSQNWDRFLTSGGERGGFSDSGTGDGASRARQRVADALGDLGPGLGDVVLRTCCFLEGLETAEKRMGWAARSGKVVLRIALQRLKRHYEERYGTMGPLIG